MTKNCRLKADHVTTHDGQENTDRLAEETPVIVTLSETTAPFDERAAV